MILKKWSGKSAAACAIELGLLAALTGAGALQGFSQQELAAAPANTKKGAAAIALVNAADAQQWQALASALGWQVVMAPGDPNVNIDQRVIALAAAVDAAVKSGAVDATRVYVAGRGESSAMVFYAIARMPDRWAAGVALGGTPKPAIDTNRVFAANFMATPVLWTSGNAEDEALAQKLKASGMSVEWRSAASTSNEAIVQWLAARKRDEFPASIDCETNSPNFASCFWIQMTKFDAGERNDVLPQSLIPGDLGASLDLGPFNYRANEPGPGVLVAFLPEKYSGPLKQGDRIVALDGKPLDDAKQLLDLLQKSTETRPAVVMVQRGKDRVRIETRIVVPRRDPVVTARVQAHYLPEFHQIEIISRAATEMRVNIPEAWIPNDLFWNGLSLENVHTAGCHLLKLEKELLRAGPCE
jgi:predicted esterase